MKNKYEIVLHALLTSTPIPIQGRIFKLFRPDDYIETPSGTYIADKYWVGIEMYKGDQKVYIGTGLSLTQLLEYIDNFSDEEIKKIENDTLLQCMNNTVDYVMKRKREKK